MEEEELQPWSLSLTIWCFLGYLTDASIKARCTLRKAKCVTCWKLWYFSWFFGISSWLKRQNHWEPYRWEHELMLYTAGLKCFQPKEQQVNSVAFYRSFRCINNIHVIMSLFAARPYVWKAFISENYRLYIEADCHWSSLLNFFQVKPTYSHL